MILWINFFTFLSKTLRKFDSVVFISSLPQWTIATFSILPFGWVLNFSVTQFLAFPTLVLRSRKNFNFQFLSCIQTLQLSFVYSNVWLAQYCSSFNPNGTRSVVAHFAIAWFYLHNEYWRKSSSGIGIT